MLPSGASAIAEGDLVIAYLGPEDLQPVVINPGATFHCRFGAFKHSDLIGQPFGARVVASASKQVPTPTRFIYVLRPTPELWTRALPHRTQILYQADIAFISAQLELKPGSVVVESGTGSGSFSHAIIRTIAPTGHLHTFEYHAPRAEQAKREFVEHKLGHYVTVSHRDVCKDGFGLVDLADAVFLDLPSPWEAIENAKQTLKKHVVTRICTFSPSIEQVMRNCDALRLHGFVEVKTFETLQRHYELRAPDEAVSLHAFIESFDSPVQGSKKRARSCDGASTTETTAALSSSSTPKLTREMRGHTSYLTFATLLPPVPS